MSTSSPVKEFMPVALCTPFLFLRIKARHETVNFSPLTCALIKLDLAGLQRESGMLKKF